MNLYLAEIELSLWRFAGRQAQIWWRDDDARIATGDLRRLVDLSNQFEAPLTLAVIPDGRPEDIVSVISGTRQIVIAQHGTNHKSRAFPGDAPNEFCRTDTIAEIVGQVSRGADRLAGLPGVIDLYVPPFNQVSAPLPDALSQLGRRAISGWGGFSRLTAGVARLDTHLDLLRWGVAPRFRGAVKFTTKLASELRKRRRAGAWDEPIGLLTHHLNHDPAAWDYLVAFLGRLQNDPSIAMVDARASLRTRFGVDIAAGLGAAIDFIEYPRPVRSLRRDGAYGDI